MSSMSLLMKRKIIFEKIRCIITLILSDFELSAQLYRRIPILNVSFDTICSLHSQITQDERFIIYFPWVRNGIYCNEVKMDLNVGL